MRITFARIALASLIFTIHLLIGPSANAQQFTISGAGELNLESDTITEQGRVTKYFGMNVTGSGESIIRVTVGDQSYDDPYEFQTNPTQLYSYLLSYDLAEDISIAFRRGVFGTVTLSILNQAQEVQASTSVIVDVTLKKNNCKKHPSPRLKKCARVNLDTASNRLKELFARKFAQSIRGPIVLEP